MGTKSEPLLARLMRVLENKRWILRLPPQAHLWHHDLVEGDELVGDETVLDSVKPTQDRSLKKGSVVPALLKRSSMLRDVANDI